VEPPRGWYGRPVTAATILAALLSLSLYALLGLRLGPAAEQRASSFVVVIEHFGVDSREIERTITKPLEDAISLIPGIAEMRSTSEYGKARVVVLTESRSTGNSVFLRLRDAVERVYIGLPGSVQKPQILSSSMNRRPVFVAAVQAPGLREQDLFHWVETQIKPSLQKISGVGEVEVGGGEIREIHVRVDPRKAAQRGLSFQELAVQLQSQDLLLPTGSLKSLNLELPVALAGKLGTIDSLARLPLSLPGGGTLPLSQIALVEYGVREKESISRVDGRKTVVLAVQSSGTANLIALSRALRSEVAGWQARGLDFQIILDRGLVLEQAISHIISALLAGLMAVTVLLPLFIGELRRLLALALTLPATALVTVGALAAAGISLDEYILSGLAVGIGTVIDAGVILSERRNAQSVAAVIPPLLGSLAATLIVLLPLFFLEFVSTGLRQVAVSIGLILLASFILSAGFLPAFTLAPSLEPRIHLLPGLRRIFRARLQRKTMRLFHRLIEWVLDRRGFVLAGGLLLTLAMALALVASPKDFSPLIQDNSIFAHIELEPQATVEAVDERIEAYSRELAALAGVQMIESIARSGYAEMEVRFEPAEIPRERLARIMQAYGERIPNGFVYLPEGVSRGERSIELAVIGDDDALLKQLAQAAARELAAERWVRQVVLNFKDPPPALVLSVDHRKAAEYGVQTADIVGALRWALRGPVALKWIEQDREMDLRIMEAGAREASRRSILSTPLASAYGARLAVGNLVRPRMEPQGAKIYRLNRQRAVFLTLHTAGRGIDQAVEGIWKALGRVPLPKGYAFELDRELIRLAESFRLLWLALGFGALFIFIVLAALCESLTAPLLILSVLPTSLAFPVLAMFLSAEPIRIPVLVGLIMLCGMVLTNSILIIDALRRRLSRASPTTPALHIRACMHLALRQRIRPLLITSSAAIVGTLPLLFTGAQGTGFMTALAFIVLWGILGSLLSTLLIVPALCSLFSGPLLRRNEAAK
jgi:HAE1 family hydrophobic/amphiphilic exporter-1